VDFGPAFRACKILCRVIEPIGTLSPHEVLGRLFRGPCQIFDHHDSVPRITGRVVPFHLSQLPDLKESDNHRQPACRSAQVREGRGSLGEPESLPGSKSLQMDITPTVKQLTSNIDNIF
jgi:hypothetical protein